MPIFFGNRMSSFDLSVLLTMCQPARIGTRFARIWAVTCVMQVAPTIEINNIKNIKRKKERHYYGKDYWYRFRND